MLAAFDTVASVLGEHGGLGHGGPEGPLARREKGPAAWSATGPWRAQSESIRTLGRLTFDVELGEAGEDPLYQRLSESAWHLRKLGWTFERIGEKLAVSRGTAALAVRWAETVRGSDGEVSHRTPKFEAIAQAARELHAAGASINQIAERLSVSWHVAKSAVSGSWCRSPG